MIENVLKYLNNVPSDKRSHALYGLILYCYIELYDPTVAIIAVVVIGLAKEVYDYVTPNHTCDYLDAIATFVIPLTLYGISWYV